ncbi:MAG: TM0106 family RecB-like putative nuclease [Planctomycetaceae bacterium]|nr:TM0106 family RecB-like putative nuclease [Planctomycetaceae bacterium]
MQVTGSVVTPAATDLSNHLACRHLTSLNRKSALGEIHKPFRHDALLESLIERGLDHEKAYIEFLRAEGKSVVDVRDFVGDAAGKKTIDAMTSGVDVVAQAALQHDGWRGRPDILQRVDLPSDLGGWSYEVADTKLAVNTRAGTILQLCLYSDILSTVQGHLPHRMSVVKPGDLFDVETLYVGHYLAYYRLVKRWLVSDIAAPPTDTYPHPVPHCEICQWWSICEQRRRADDHLSFVAGIHKHQIIELYRQDISKLEQFAASEQSLPERPKRGSLEAFDRVHKQAKIQFEARTSGKLKYEFLDLEDGRGFQCLPEPDPGDIFFDIEGDPHALDGGLEYLLGYVVLDDVGNAQYKAHWAVDRPSEKIVFEQFIDFVMQRWSKFPGMHVYHYAHYEPSAVRRLAMRHATREEEVDQLLRGERFIDLYAVVRQGVRASVESYSIKKLEPFYGYERLAELEDARHSLRRVERALELKLPSGILDDDKKLVEAYNEDDCQSTLRLREWLENLRERQIASGRAIDRPKLKDGLASEELQEKSEQVLEVFKKLVDGVPDTDRDEHESARWLLAHLLDYFRREDKCVWWEYFRLQELEPDELLLERKAIYGLQFVKQIPGRPGERTVTHRYRFPMQEAQLRAGENLVARNHTNIGSVVEVNLRTGTLDIKKTKASSGIHPSEVMVFDRVRPAPLPESLLEFARLMLRHLKHEPLESARYDLLSKSPPRLQSLQMPLAEEPKDAAVLLALDLNNSILPIQGPPGAGKTFVGGHMITELAKRGKRIGVTAVSHKVILNLLQEVLEQSNGSISVAHKVNSKADDPPQAIAILKSTDDALTAIGQGAVVGGTAWLWANADAEQALDYLFVDEAGQMSLAMALAAGRAAKNIILLGDPQQLEQPQQGSHPEGAEVTALTHLLDGHDTITEDRGLFMPNTWRLHPAICEFTSEQYYEGRLSSRPGLECQMITGGLHVPEAGLAFVPVVHEGNQNRSEEEAERIRSIFDELLDGNHTWRNARNEEATVTLSDILVVAPYNAQVALLQDTLPDGARVGTVDKFQGQEAAIVIYSATSSSVEDAPRGMTFLYSPNRMNVATSRARCLVILVGSPELFHPECATPEQIRLANGFCRFAEMATRVAVEIHSVD